jgi:hypothetical protein
MAFRLTSALVSLSMDGTSLLSEPRARFFQHDSTIYLKIAAEVFAMGDAVSVENVRLLSGTDQERVPVSRAAFEDRGLRFVCIGNGNWKAIGKFDPSLNARSREEIMTISARLRQVRITRSERSQNSTKGSKRKRQPAR